MNINGIVNNDCIKCSEVCNIKKKKKKKNKKSKIIDPTEGKPENRQIKFNPKMSKQNCNKLSQLFCSFLVWLR